MPDLKDAARQALEALEELNGWQSLAPPLASEAGRQAAINLRAALAEEALQRLTDVHQEIEAALEQPEQDQFCDSHCTWLDHHPDCVRAEQPQRTLTDEIIANLWHANGGFHHHFARAIERWLKGRA